MYYYFSYAINNINYNFIEKNKNIVGIYEGRIEKDSNYMEKETELIKKAHKELKEYFSGDRKEFTIDLSPEGTDFQKRVWEELRKIPYGEKRTYKEIAENIGNSKGYRAVGNANNKNPILIMIPCHRVVGIDGKLTGFRLGLDMKRDLLELEEKNR